MTKPSIQKLTPEIKKLIADKINQSIPDEAIIKEYSESYEISPEILRQIKESIQRSSTSIHIKDQTAFEDAMQNGQRMLDEVAVVGGQFAMLNKKGEMSSMAFGEKILGEAEQISNQTQIGVGSVTKLFTAVTLFNIIDQEKQAVATGSITDDQQKFKDGLDTKLSSFMGDLEEKYKYCKYLQEIKKMPHYQDITLRNLLEHDAGLHLRDNESLGVKQLLGAGLPTPDKILDNHLDEKEEFGKYRYNNLGYELLGMVMSVATNKTSEELLEENVVKKFGLQNTSLKTQPSADVATGQYHIDGFEHDGQKIPAQYMDFTRNGNSVFAGGALSNAQDLANFMQKTFAGDAFQSDYIKGEIEGMKKGRGGIEKPDGSKCVNGVNYIDGKLLHLGDNADSKSYASYDVKDGSVSAYAVTGENLSVKLASEALELEKKDGKIAQDTKIDDAMILGKIRELEERGFDFKKLNGLEKEGKSMQDIAKIVRETPSPAPSGASARVVEAQTSPQVGLAGDGSSKSSGGR